MEKNLPKKLLSLFLAFCMLLSLMPTVIVAKAAEPVEYDENGQTQSISEYVIVDSSYNTAQNTWGNGTSSPKWYYVTGGSEGSPITFSQGITISGTVYILLADGCYLKSTGTDNNAGITVSGEGSRLTICGQSQGTGTLEAIGGGDYGAGIGGNGSSTSNGDNGENITINGGTVTATSTNGAGIGGGGGGGGNGGNGTITITGGTVTATSANGDKIGGGKGATGINTDNTISITGGVFNYDPSTYVSTDDYDVKEIVDNKYIVGLKNTVIVDVTSQKVTSGKFAFNPSGYVAEGYTALITNEMSSDRNIYVVCATSAYSQYLGTDGMMHDIPAADTITLITSSENHSSWGKPGKTTWYYVTGGSATGNNPITFKGINTRSDVRIVLKDDCYLKTTGENGMAGITVYGDGNSLTIYGQQNGTGKLDAISSNERGSGCGAGIGGSYQAPGNNITINGGIVTAQSLGSGAGIGGSGTRNGSNITINGGTVTASSVGGAGIGGGGGDSRGSNGGNGNNIIINGGTVIATSQNGAGIGGGGGDGNGGNGGNSNNIIINGGIVTATSANGDKIGGGKGATGINTDNTISITGGVFNYEVTATSPATTTKIAEDKYIVGTNVTVDETAKAITGGTFTIDPTDYMASGCMVKKNAETPVSWTVISASVTISGTMEVGQLLTATVEPTDVTATYQWYQGDTAISGATTSTYTPNEADAGKVIKVVVTGTDNYSGTVEAKDTVNYSTLSEAFEKASEDPNNPTKIKLTKDVTENVTLAEGKYVELDLNGHVLHGTGTGSVITNYGNLTITDSDTTKEHKFSKLNALWVFSEETGSTVKGGVITGGDALQGGGISNDGTLTINAGTIAGNTSTIYGGGVYNSGTFTMNGGSICGNTASLGGGVCNNGTFTVGKTAKISDNTDNNVYLPTGKSITTNTGENAPAQGMSIGITIESVSEEETEDAPGVGKFADFGEYVANPTAYFFADDPKCKVQEDQDNKYLELCLKPVICKIGENEYESITKALVGASTVKTSPTKIQLVDNTSEDVVIARGTYVEIDLNGFVLKGTGTNSVIINKGTLTITDSKATEPHYFIKDAETGLWTLAADQTEETDTVVYGGVITGGGNVDNGGGVYNTPLGTFNMYGGNIIGNSATNGGGVYNDKTFTVGGTAKVIGNKGSNVYLPSSKQIKLGTSTNAPTDGMKVGVTVTGITNVGDSVAFTNTNVTTDYSKYFTADNTDYHVKYESNTLSVFYPAVERTGGTQTVTEYYDTLSIALTDVSADSSKPTKIKLLADVTENVTIAANTYVEIDLNGHILKGDGTASVIYIEGDLTLTDSNTTATHKFDTANIPWVLAADDAEGDTIKTVYGGVITGGTGTSIGSNKYGGGVCNKQGTFTMNGGTICGNTNTGEGGGVATYGVSTFTMNGGTISGNATSKRGGGVYNCDSSTFTMNNGEISGNKAANRGGGVENHKTFTMNGGTISGNTAKEGGGVFTDGTSKSTTIYFKMTGGTICNNTASATGGGVYNYLYSVFDMSGSATISDNTATKGGGVYNTSNRTFTVGGTAKVTDNTNSNVYLPNSKYITIGTPAEGMKIGVTTQSTATMTDAVQLTTNCAEANIAYIIPDNEDYKVQFNSTGNYLELIEKPDVCQIDETKYKSIKKALVTASITAGSYTTIQLIADVTENVTIAAGKYVELDLNGYVLKGDGTTSVIFNQGNLKITDTSETSTVHYFTDERCVHGIAIGKECKKCTVTASTASKDGCFETYTTTQPTGTEGVDYITVSGGVITGGSAVDGGGVNNREGSSLTMTGGTICGNTASDRGGGVYSYSSTFTMTGGTICDNTASGDGGGGVYNGYSSTFTMTGGTISDNTAAKDSGGVYIYTYGTFNMSDGEISGNTATGNGGGVYIYGSVYNGGTFNMSGGEISGNTATGNGGGVYIYGGKSYFTVGGIAKVTGNTKSDGTTASNVYLPSGKTITIGNGTDAGKNGVPVPAEGMEIGVTTETAVTYGTFLAFTDNTAATGYAGYFKADASTQENQILVRYDTTGGYLMLIFAVAERDYTAEANGIYYESITAALENASATDSSPTKIKLIADVTENVTIAAGTYVEIDLNGHILKPKNTYISAIVNNGNLTLTDTSDEKSGKITGCTDDGVCSYNSSTFTMNGGTISNNGAYGVCNYGTFIMNGGTINNNGKSGVYVNNGPFTMNDGTISDNTESGVYVGSGQNFTMNGGTISKNKNSGVYNYNIFTMNGGTITDNTVTYGGGGVYNISTFTMSGGTICNNKATSTSSNGGGVYHNSGTFTMSGGEISGNTATSNGGGVYTAFSSTFEMSGGTICGNKVTGISSNGGGVYTSNMSMKGGTISGNSASNGGGVYTYEKFTMKGGTISGNSASNGGGVYNNYGAFTMVGGTISGNSASNCGGVYNNYSAFTMVGGTISGNSASNGGGVYNNYSAFTMVGGVIGLTDEQYTAYLASLEPNYTGTYTGPLPNIATTKGAGVYQNGTMKVGGSAVILHNTLTDTNKTNSNLHCVQTIAFSSGNAFSERAKISVTIDDTLTNQIFTDSTLVDAAKYFTGDKEGYNAEQKTAGSTTGLTLVKYVWEISNGTIKSGVSGIPATKTADIAPLLSNYSAGTIKLLQDTNENVTIEKGQNVTIDLNGHVLKGDGTTSVIINNGILTITDSSSNKNGVITGGNATNGGGVFNNEKFTMNGGSISGNKATNGAGVYNNNEFIMNGGSISSTNSANIATNGGGVYNNRRFVMNKTAEISGNQATDGAGVYNVDSLTMNESVNVYNNTATGNGGGVYNYDDAIFTMNNGNINSNTAKNGGGVYNKDYATFTMKDSAGINSNTATENGGGVYNINYSTLTMNDATRISKNTAKNGGGVYNIKYATLMMNDTASIRRNTNTSSNGGGVYNDKAKVLMSDSANIIGNTATKNGGGVFNTNKVTFTMVDSAYIGGNSSANGGGVYNDTKSTFTMNDLTYISDNEVDENGGGVYNVGTFEMNGSSVEENTATKGAGIYNIGSLDLLNNSSVIDNDGSGVYCLGSDSAVYIERKVFIADNTTTNLCLVDGAKATLSTLSSKSDISVTLLDDENQAIAGAFTENGSAIYAKYIKADDAKTYKVKFVSDHLELIPGEPVVKDSNEKTYETIEEALNANASAITLIANVEENVTIPAGATVTIDLNGFTWKPKSAGSVITNKGNLTIVDNSENETGAITGGAANYGGGVYNDTNATFTILSGSITGNTAYTDGGGVYNKGTFTVGGTAKVTDNTNGNVYLTNGTTITISDETAPASGMSIGVTMATVGNFATGAETAKAYFTSDNNKYEVEYADDTLKLVKVKVAVFVAEVPAKCTKDGCKAHWVYEDPDTGAKMYYEDNAGTQGTETTLEALTIPATGEHTGDGQFSSWTWFSTANGMKASWIEKCSVCGGSILHEVTPTADTSVAGKVTYTVTNTVGGQVYTSTKEVVTTCKVTFNGQETSYNYGATVKLTETEAKNWYIVVNGNDSLIKTANTSYSFTVKNDVTIITKEATDAEPVLSFTSVGREDNPANGEGYTKIVYSVQWSVPTGYTFVGAGLKRAYDVGEEPLYDALTTTNATTLTSANGVYSPTVSMKPATSLKSITAVGYLTYKDNTTGEEKTIYSNFIFAAGVEG